MQPKQHVTDILLPLITAILIGALAGLGAVFFRWLTHQCIDALDLIGQFWHPTAAHLSWWWRMLLPSLAGLLIGPIIVFFAPEIRGPGVPEVMEAMAQEHRSRHPSFPGGHRLPILRTSPVLSHGPGGCKKHSSTGQWL